MIWSTPSSKNLQVVSRSAFCGGIASCPFDPKVEEEEDTEDIANLMENGKGCGRKYCLAIPDRSDG